MRERNQNTQNERDKEEQKQPKIKEAFVNEQVTKFFEIPIKEPSVALSDVKNPSLVDGLRTQSSPLFQKSTKVPTKQNLQTSSSAEKPTSPAITVTSWEETNKGQDEYTTHGSHIRHQSSIDNFSHISGNNMQNSFHTLTKVPRNNNNNTMAYNLSESKHEKESSQLEENNDSLSTSLKCPDSLGSSVSHTEKIGNEDSLEKTIYHDDNSVDKDSLIDSKQERSENTLNMNNPEGYFDSISVSGEDYLLSESEKQARGNEQHPPKKKLILPTSISFNDSFSSDTSPFNTSLDVSIDSVNNPNDSNKKCNNGSTTLDSLEDQQAKVIPMVGHLQQQTLHQQGQVLGTSPNNGSFQCSSTPHLNHQNIPPGHQQVTKYPVNVMQRSSSNLASQTVYGSIDNSSGVNVPRRAAARPEYSVLEVKSGAGSNITTNTVSPNQYASAPRPILSNTNYLYGKTAFPYYGYGHNLHLYRDAPRTNSHVSESSENMNKSKSRLAHHNEQMTSSLANQNNSPMITRSQSQPIAPSRNSTLSIDHPEAALDSTIKGVIQQPRPVVMNVPGATIGQSMSHPNQSVVKMAAEKMKRKFLGWN